MPPTSENGTFIITSPAYIGDPNIKNSSTKMMAIVIGMITVSRFCARCRFSNCPPQVTS